MKLIQTATFDVPEFEMKPQWIYRPRISPEHLRRLWFAKQETGKPITKLIAEALDFYFENQERG
jgi:hypothetical protein